ncbi:MAG: FKBP-type peptidyl-prolyl cis-trans isomerase, partial [Nanoarchaeota archaeon]
MKTKIGDFIELDYVAKTKNDNKVFDLTNEEKAKEFNLYDEKRSYHAIKICLGYNDIIPGLDEALIDKEPGKYVIEIKAEKAFGNKDHSLIKLVPNSVFTKQNIKPFPGLMVNIDGFIGVIRSSSSGRVLVDFNHPLAGKDLVY